VKFLLPFGLLVSLGSHLDVRPPAALAHARLPIVASAVELPQTLPLPAASETRAALPTILWSIWLCGLAVHLFAWARRWRTVRSTLRAATPLRVDAPIPVLTTPARLEPGVFGILRPVLLLPVGLADRLTPEQFRAILLHEMCHVRRRDNLTAAIHMLVESLFWFAPPLWYIRGRLIEERERACDEHVLAQTRAPDEYAEGILSVCRFYVASPLLCSSGVTGSDLKRRIDEIVSPRILRDLSAAKKLLLACAALAVIGLPVFTGMLRAADPVSFEVASIKEDTSSRLVEWSVLPGGRLSIKGAPLRAIISAAYHVPLQSVRLSGGPNWVNSTYYDIEATPPKGSIPEGLSQREVEKKVYAMLQVLLEDRFKLTMHREQKELPVYAIVVGKGGPKLQRAPVEDEAGCEQAKIACHQIMGGQGRGLHAKAVTISDIASHVENWTDKPMVDKTGLSGLFEVDTEGWIPMKGPVNLGPGEGIPDALRPTLSAVFDRLGLRMENQRAAVETFTIEHVERPAEN
jgi:uncharacterized protein (TIGR03435 family)